MDRDTKATPKAATAATKRTARTKTAKPASKAAEPVKRTTKSKTPTKAVKTTKTTIRKPKHPYMVNDQEWDKQAVMDIVCDYIASTSKSIASILAAGHDGNTLPRYATVARWLAEQDENGANPLRDQYARAKEAQADYMAEEMAELHNKAWVPLLDDDGKPIIIDGKPLMTVDKSSAAIVRLEAENKKWLMGKLRPKKYADKQQHEVTGANGGAIQVASTVTFVEPKRYREDDDE